DVVLPTPPFSLINPTVTAIFIPYKSLFFGRGNSVNAFLDVQYNVSVLLAIKRKKPTGESVFSRVQ
ncbi:hypothetical protein ODS05_24535, partial [Escherichia coli]|nr:hypothetical protein [Escherichia coli]